MKTNKDIRLLTIIFNFDINFNEINRFRGAIIKATHQANSLFHNHTNNSTIYRYPLIQYKQLNKKASILCIEEGVEGIHDFFSQTDWKIDIGYGLKSLRVDKINAGHFKIGIWKKLFYYKINRWLPLNQNNYRKYQQAEGLREKLEMLENILTGHILSFLQGIDVYANERIKVNIKDVFSQRLVEYKGQKMQSFSLIFSTNLSLPNFIGLGKGSSSGFGIIKETKIKYNE